ncbi:helix-turn-helix transcriptional regulator [Actinophytocola xanthii]|uniref:HTH luxR-type domain-containing protein n=1 Tax=Actinophytocola xanthii TaxID=1912961 RepID=A0A1Q8CVZ8_9PSEU|nr:response regulator transcription factor [Actinophytocola xanthii]OLF18534.1 hypothetical protein BU204_06185 [Actinophytocola xanthii]
MEPVHVAIEAADTFTAVGLANRLASRPEVRVVDRTRLSGRGVLVVAADHDSFGESAFLADPGLPKVLVTDFLTEEDLRAAVEVRVVSVLSRADAAGDRFVAELLAVAAGEGTMPAEAFDRLLDQARRATLSRPRLSDREVEVLRLMADGWDTADMASRLCYSERTVKNVIYSLTSRLKLRSRPHAVAFAMRAGLI